MKQQKVRNWLICLIIALCPVVSFADTFDVQAAHKELQDISNYATQPQVNTQLLKNLQNKVTNLQTQANSCVSYQTTQVAEFVSLEQELIALGNDYPNYANESAYVKDKKQAAAVRLFNCRLFVTQADDVHKEIQTRVQEIASHENSVAGKPIYEAISGVFLTVGVFLIFTAIIYLGNILFDHTKLHNLTIVRRQRYPEFVIFKFSLYALIAIWVILMMLEWWGVPVNILGKVKQGLLEGGTVYGVHIIPMRLLLGIMVFAIIQIAWKYSLYYVAKKQKFDPEGDSQVVLTSLLSYVVFTLAILIGLAISGVNFTGLAIVAGALTVGIGFGLQNIVNNFVSGIILLLEKTVKPGDRVSIKGYEGFVRKINLRFTRIATSNKDDVLIPNSDLISTPIINFEFEDKLSTIKCFVGVAYGSDLELVRQTLFNVAQKHADVLHDPLNKPKVFLNEFGENNLLFELECTIIDVNRKHIVTSDLYFLIADAFNENKIIMSYPQREVRITQGG